MRSRLEREPLSVLYYISFKSLIIYSYCSYTRGCLGHHLCALRALLSCTGDKNMYVSYYVTNLTNFYELSPMYWKGIIHCTINTTKCNALHLQLQKCRSPLLPPVGLSVLTRRAANTEGTFHFSHEGYVGFPVPSLSQDMTTSNGNEDT